MKKEQFLISYELERLRKKFIKREIDLSDFIRRIVNFTDVDVSKGLNIDKILESNQAFSRKLAKASAMKSGPKFQLKRQVALEKIEHDKEKLRIYVYYFNKYHNEFGRALRVLIDSYKDRMHRKS